MQKWSDQISEFLFTETKKFVPEDSDEEIMEGLVELKAQAPEAPDEQILDGIKKAKLRDNLKAKKGSGQGDQPGQPELAMQAPTPEESIPGGAPQKAPQGAQEPQKPQGIDMASEEAKAVPEAPVPENKPMVPGVQQTASQERSEAPDASLTTGQNIAAAIGAFGAGLQGQSAVDAGLRLKQGMREANERSLGIGASVGPDGKPLKAEDDPNSPISKTKRESLAKNPILMKKYPNVDLSQLSFNQMDILLKGVIDEYKFEEAELEAETNETKAKEQEAKATQYREELEAHRADPKPTGYKQSMDLVSKHFSLPENSKDLTMKTKAVEDLGRIESAQVKINTLNKILDQLPPNMTANDMQLNHSEKVEAIKTLMASLQRVPGGDDSTPISDLPGGAIVDKFLQGNTTVAQIRAGVTSTAAALVESPTLRGLGINPRLEGVYEKAEDTPGYKAPEKKKDPKSPAKYPKTLRKGNKTARVANAEEEREARAEGWQ